MPYDYILKPPTEVLMDCSPTLATASQEMFMHYSDSPFLPSPYPQMTTLQSRPTLFFIRECQNCTPKTLDIAFQALLPTRQGLAPLGFSQFNLTGCRRPSPLPSLFVYEDCARSGGPVGPHQNILGHQAGPRPCPISCNLQPPQYHPSCSSDDTLCKGTT